ncbi:hypothetical protein AB0I28_12335 [Phytomonospora sp. NPDC050363]|uniref:hypothetical protein n=1 Tax=Phytomonospora sp. NPDC050363 TaxID=3155642 RepID=UPI0033D958A1
MNAPAPFMNSNDRLSRWEKARRTKAWRSSAFLLARVNHLPQGLERIRVDAVLYFTTARDRDTSNYELTLKPIVDALGPDKSRVSKDKQGRLKRVEAPGWGVIPNDTPKHLSGPHIVLDEIPLGDVLSFGKVQLTITDLTPTVESAA